MSKAIERRMTLKDQVTPTMSKINKSTLSYKKGMRDLKQEGQETWFGLKRGMLGVVAAGAALLGSVLTINKMEDAYRAQVEAETKLQAVMMNTPGVTKEAIKSVSDYAGELEKTAGIVTGDVITAGAQQIATFQLQADSIKKLMPGMADLIAQQKGLNATQNDAVSVGNMIGKVMSGQIGALSRAGIIFNETEAKLLKYGNEQERVATLAEVLRKNVGGVNKALSETDIGSIQRAKNIMGEFEEIFGGVIVSIKGKFAKAFMEDLPAIEAQVNTVASSINNWVDGGGIDRFVDTLKIALDTTKQLSPVIGVLAAGLIAYKAAAVISTMATWSLNAAMAANPIGAVILIIVGLIAVITLLRKNKDLLKLKFMETWNAVAGIVENTINRKINMFNLYLSAVSFLVNSVKFYFYDMWDSVVQMAENGVSKMAKPLNAVLSALGKETISVDLSSKSSGMKKPVWEKQDFIKQIEVKRFSDDTIMGQVEAAKREKQVKELEKASKNNEILAEAIEGNTEAVKGNTSALKNSSSDLTGEQIADKLLPRLERVVYG